MTTQAVEDELVAELARDVVAKTAPHELPLFRATSEEYFKDPDRVLDPGEAKDEMLGFGVGEVAMLLGPAALVVAREVVTFVAAEVGKSAKEESSPIIRSLVRRVFRRGGQANGPAEQAPPPVELTADQLAEVHRIALEKAQQLRLPADKAELLADSMVGELTTG